MNERSRDRWYSRDLPVLQHIVDALDQGSDLVDDEAMAEALGITHEDAVAAIENLERGGYVTDISWTFGPNFSVTQVTERALRATGIWPNEETAGDQLLWILEQKVEAATTPEERTRWARIRDSVVGAGREFAIELGAAMAARTMGG
jgi:hypothetical protein